MGKEKKSLGSISSGGPKIMKKKTNVKTITISKKQMKIMKKNRAPRKNSSNLHPPKNYIWYWVQPGLRKVKYVEHRGCARSVRVLK